MKQGKYEITENKMPAAGIYLMRLAGDVSGITAPGQFINLKLSGHFLRRPISICDAEVTDMDSMSGIITIIYKVLGRGTLEMTGLRAGDELDVLSGLGNGYDLKVAGDKPLLAGGGVGIPPLYLTAKALIRDGIKPAVILGYNSAEEVFFRDEFRALGCDVTVATADGSTGIRGFVTDAFRILKEEGGEFTHFYSCGPLPMLRAVYDEIYEGAGISGQLSFEERMGCGFGACMGCSIRTRDGYKRICKDGPVLRTEEILWQD